MTALIGVCGAAGCGRSIMPLLRAQVQGSATRLVFIDDAAAAAMINGHDVVDWPGFLALPADSRAVTLAIAAPAQPQNKGGLADQLPAKICRVRCLRSRSTHATGMTKSTGELGGMQGPQHQTRPNRWLVTGTSGRIGRTLVRHWQSEPPAAELILQTRREGSGLLWDPLLSSLPKALGEMSCLVAFAGLTPATGSELQENVALAEATLTAACDSGIPRVLLTSSSAVYGAPRGGAPLREADTLRPFNPYGEAKARMEAICDRWRGRGLEVCCLRIGNVAGADVLLLNGLKATAAAPLRIDRFGDGQGPLRSYIGPATLARVVAGLASHPLPLPETLNIAAPNPISMADLATEANMAWVWTEAPASAVQNITLDCTQLSNLHRFDPADSSAAEMIRQWTRLRDPT